MGPAGLGQQGPAVAGNDRGVLGGWHAPMGGLGLARGGAGSMAACAPKVTAGRPWWQWPPVMVGAREEALEVRHATVRALWLVV